MTYRTVIFPALACTFALAAGPVGAGAVRDAAAAAGTERLSSDQIGKLKELLLDHGIPPASNLAGEITREILESNREAATAALFRPPVVHPPGAAPEPAAVAEVRETRPAEPARASAPPESPSPVRNLLRKVLRFLNLLT